MKANSPAGRRNKLLGNGVPDGEEESFESLNTLYFSGDLGDFHLPGYTSESHQNQ